MAKIIRATAMFAFALALGTFGIRFFGGTASAVGKPKMPSLPRVSESPVTNVELKALDEIVSVSDSKPMIPQSLNPLSALQIPFLAAATQTGGDSDGTADLNPIGRSGVRALLSVQKIGRTETVTGFATGLDPYKAYVSLFYDAGSPGSGPCACIPSNPPPAALAATCKATNAPPVNFSQMVIGYWLPLIGSSTRTLQILKAGAPDAPGGAAFVELEKIGSVSIREDTQLGTPLPSAPDPGRFQLRACGKFKMSK